MILTSKVHRIIKISKNSANRIPKWISDINAAVGDEIVVTFDTTRGEFEKLPRVEIKNLRTGEKTMMSIKFFSESISGWKKTIELKSI